jgi:beta propeller repeat protein
MKLECRRFSSRSSVGGIGLMAIVLLGGACDRQVNVNGTRDAGEDTTSTSGGPDSTGGARADGADATNLLGGIEQYQPDASSLIPTADAGPASPDSALADASARADGIVNTGDLPGASSPDGTTSVQPDAAALTDGVVAVADLRRDGGVAVPADATAGKETAAQPDATTAPDVLASPDAAVTPDAGSGVLITGLQVLADGLSTFELPAVGSDGVSLLEYTGAGTAMAIHVTWDRVTNRWYEDSGARYIYLAANGTRDVALLYLAGSYAIQQNGGAAELSGTPLTYKEFLAANDTGFAWVDYGQISSGSGGGRAGGGGTSGSTLGAVIFQSWSGTRTTLTDNLRYRARLALSANRIAYVEYASTVSGTPGQIMVQSLGGGSAVAVAPGTLHQDRPAIAGDWVVWEEYRSSTDAVIRSKNLATGELKNLSSAIGFRTNPDVRDQRVVWEDQRSGNGDIYTYDLAGSLGEQVAVSGPGHSSGARLTSDGLVWIESNGDNVGLLWARWIQ